MQKENKNYVIFNIFLFFIISNLFSQNFTPPNNEKLNYKQIEFSWPQIPNTNHYKLNIMNGSTIIYEINTINNIIVIDGNNLN